MGTGRDGKVVSWREGTDTGENAGGHSGGDGFASHATLNRAAVPLGTEPLPSTGDELNTPRYLAISSSRVRPSPALVTDLYELTMAESYLRAGVTGRAVFSLFVRRLPPERRYLVAAGLEEALIYLEELRFTEDDLAYLAGTGRFSEPLLAHLAGLRFTGDVRAIAEGRAVFGEEPLLEVSAPIIEAQIVETYLINVLHLHSLLASKAARCVDAARGRAVIDFGLRRAHGVDAGMAAARAAYLAGCAATSNVAAGQAYGIPISGTMAHSFIMAFPSELDAFRAYARSYPDGTTLLIDTYDVLQGARHAATVAHELRAQGHHLGAVRIDSGDLAALSREVRALLDGEGLPDVQIIVSGNLDEYGIAALLDAGAPVDGFGVGTRMDASEDAPTLEMAYKLVEYEGRPVHKRSARKASLPGRKQVWRQAGADRRYTDDTVTLADERGEGEPLLVPMMKHGQRMRPAEGLDTARARWLAERDRLPEPVRALLGAGSYPVMFGPLLRALSAEGG